MTRQHPSAKVGKNVYCCLKTLLGNWRTVQLNKMRKTWIAIRYYWHSIRTERNEIHKMLKIWRRFNAAWDFSIGWKLRMHSIELFFHLIKSGIFWCVKSWTILRCFYHKNWKSAMWNSHLWNIDNLNYY